MKVRKRLKLSLIMMLSLSVTIPATSLAASYTESAATAGFSDIAKHWAKATIIWARDKQIVGGYKDGTFKPDLQVTEAEFISMFIKAFGVKLETNQAIWSEPVYTYAKSMNVAMNGGTDLAKRNGQIKRVQVAEIITGANGFHYNGNDAIQYILGNGLTNGKTSATINGYAGNDPLTRAEAIQFIKNVLDQGMTKLMQRPAELSAGSLLPALPAVVDTSLLPPGLAAVVIKLQAPLKGFPDYAIQADGSHIGIRKANQAFDTVSFIPAKVKGQVSITYLNGDNSNTSISLASEMLKAQGFAIDAEFVQSLKNAMSTGKKATVTIGSTEILIAPSPELTNNVEFWYVVQ